MEFQNTFVKLNFISNILCTYIIMFLSKKGFEEILKFYKLNVKFNFEFTAT